VDDCNGSPIKYLVVNSTTILEYEITNIPPGQTCRFRMNTVNIIGTSLKNTPTLYVLMAAIPERPPRPEYVARSGGDSRTGEKASITIQWEPPYDKGGIQILGYYVKIAEDDGDFILAYDGKVEPDVLSYKFVGLNPGTRYRFEVWCRNRLGTSAQGSEHLEVYAATYPFKMDPVRRVSVTEAGLDSTITI